MPIPLIVREDLVVESYRLVFRAWRIRNFRKENTSRLSEPCRGFQSIKKSKGGNAAELGNVRTS